MGLGVTGRGVQLIDTAGSKPNLAGPVGNETLGQTGGALSTNYPNIANGSDPMEEAATGPGSEMTGMVNRGYVTVGTEGPSTLDDATVSDDGRRRVRNINVSD